MDPNAPLPPDVNRGAGLVAVGWIECAISTVLIIGRVYTRMFIRKNMDWDDWFMVLAWALALITTSIVQVGVNNGIGRHVQYVMMDGLEQAKTAFKMTWISAPFATMSACFGKISVALFLLRLLGPNTSRTILLWFTVVSLFIVNLVLAILTFAQCSPASYLWDQLEPHAHGSCWDRSIQADFGLFQGAYSAFTDFLLAIIPLFALWNIQMKRWRKIGIMAILSLGIVAGAAGVAKTAELPSLASPDFTWAPVNLTYWYTTENWLIVIAGCFPTLRALASDIATKINSRSPSYVNMDYVSGPSWRRQNDSFRGTSLHALRKVQKGDQSVTNLELGSVADLRSERA